MYGAGWEKTKLVTTSKKLKVFACLSPAPSAEVSFLMYPAQKTALPPYIFLNNRSSLTYWGSLYECWKV